MLKFKLTAFSLILSLLTIGICWSSEIDFKLIRNLNHLPTQRISFNQMLPIISQFLG
jgi:hypothetical protein